MISAPPASPGRPEAAGSRSGVLPASLPAVEPVLEAEHAAEAPGGDDPGGPVRKLAAMSQPASFYEAVGGEETFSRLVHRFYQGVAEDPVLRPVYPAKDLGPAEEHLRLFLIQYWGGPRTYDELRGHPRLRMRHARFAIGEAERDAWLRHMREALDELEPGPGAGRAAMGLPGDGRAQPGQRRASASRRPDPGVTPRPLAAAMTGWG